MHISAATEVENAFVAACQANTIRDVELRARLTQIVCRWHRAEETERDLVLQHLRKQFPLLPEYLKALDNPAFQERDDSDIIAEAVLNWNTLDVTFRNYATTVLKSASEPQPAYPH